LFEDLIRTSMKTSAPMWREKQGESIPSINRTSNSKLRLLSAAGYFER
jgi:hypothetical protein